MKFLKPATKTILTLSVATIGIGAVPTSHAQTVSKVDTIVNTKAAPYNCVCSLSITRRKNLVSKPTNSSTGFLIKPNVILTAAHNVHSNGFSNVIDVNIYPGRYKNSYAHSNIRLPKKGLRKNLIRVHPSYKFSDGGRIKYDYAIIIIPQRLIDAAKDWPKKACFELDDNYTLKKDDKINIAGYPADEKEGYDGSVMLNQSQQTVELKNRSFIHKFTTTGGSSGSPIWVEANGKRVVVGVHTFGEAATTINPEDVALITKWIKAIEE